MKAVVGDRILVHGHKVGDRERQAEVLEVLGEGEQLRYRVRWEEDGHESTFFPGTDAVVQHTGDG